MLVGAPRKRGTDKHAMEDHLRELAELADTAGAEVVGWVTQQIDRPHPGTYLGSGKIDELAERARELDASLVIFDDELSPSQGNNIEKMVGKRVVDRAELILDIFALRARTSEAKMQVELAQLEYMLPRLTRMWTHLERYKAGIGMRGPGETQLETDRRLVNHRIKLLKVRLRDVERSREVQRQSRQHEFKASLVGYTNAGKSSILRALAEAPEVHVEDRLFATLDPLTREADVGDARVLLTDTVGFIRKLPHHLVASFRATLEEVNEADLLLHVIDAGHAHWEEHKFVVDTVLEELGANEQPVLLVFNKIDQLDEDALHALHERVTDRKANAVFVSAVAEDGLEPLRRALVAASREGRPVAEVEMSVSDGRLLAELHRDGEVLGQRTSEDRLIIRARVDEALIGRLRHGGAEVRVAQRGSERKRRPAPDEGEQEAVDPMLP
ncbi:MAG: GTPase HflX [Gemmatimonadaceae bacterium]|nr:GTPase HflX [Gemmatimonadaceae bacterium]